MCPLVCFSCRIKSGIHLQRYVWNICRRWRTWRKEVGGRNKVAFQCTVSELSMSAHSSLRLSLIVLSQKSQHPFTPSWVQLLTAWVESTCPMTSTKDPLQNCRTSSKLARNKLDGRHGQLYAGSITSSCQPKHPSLINPRRTLLYPHQNRRRSSSQTPRDKTVPCPR